MRTHAVLLLLCLAVLAGGCSAERFSFGVGRDGPKTYRVDKKAEAEFDHAVELVTDLKYEEAAVKLGPLMAVFAEAGSPAYAAESGFWLAYCREKLGDPNEARTLYDLVARKYPDTPASRQAIARLGRMK
ncbi:MAG: tetratricopeptide repeat protein [Planctomycetota bacterium]